MADKKPLDQEVSQVLPGVGKDISSLLTNFGLNTAAVTALLNDIRDIDASYGFKFNLESAVRQALTATSSKNDLESVLKRIGLYTAGISNNVTTQPFVFSFQNLGANFAGPAKFYNNASDLGSERWILPMPPADFSISVPNSQGTVSTVHGFNYTHAGNIELDELSFESFFPYIGGTGDRPGFLPDYIELGGGNYNYRHRDPREWVENLVTAMRANQPLIFSVYSVDAAGQIVSDQGHEIIEPTAMSVASFEWDMGSSVGGSRRDVNYSISLKRWRRQSISITNYVAQPTIYTKYNLSTVKGKSYNHITVPSKGKNAAGVDQGPTLAQIAIDILHDARRWKDIASLNRFYKTEPAYIPSTKAGKQKNLIKTANVKRSHRPKVGRPLKVPKS